MEDNSGFFEEIEEEDVEEVELSAREEEYDNSEVFKESTTYQEVEGVIKELEEDDNGTDSVYTSEDLSSDISQTGNVKVIYVNKNSVQNNKETVSDCQVVILDPAQYEVLIDEISSLRQENYQSVTVSQNDYSGQISELHELAQGSLLVNVMMFALCFGYFVKETVFRGL